MKTIGLLGGMHWESTSAYYHTINAVAREQLGGVHSAPCLIYSVDYHPIRQSLVADRWGDVGQALAGAARALERGGADFLVICTNIMHRVAAPVRAAVGIPLLHVADVAACRLRAAGFSRVGLVGTRQVMEQDFHREPLERLGLDIITPPEEERRWCHELIFRELWCGPLRAPDREIMRRMLADMAARGAQVILVACTALAPHLTHEDAPVPLWESDSLHAHEAALVGLEEVPLPE